MSKPFLKWPAQNGVVFRVHCDSTPKPSDLRSLARALEQLASAQAHNLTFAGVSIGCDTAEEFEALLKYIGNTIATFENANEAYKALKNAKPGSPT